MDVDNNRAESKRCAELRIGRHTGRLGVSKEFLKKGVEGGRGAARLSLLVVLITDTEVVQEIDAQEPSSVRQGALCQRCFRRLPDRKRLQDRRHRGSEQIQP